jgi:hypothetical protein
MRLRHIVLLCVALAGTVAHAAEQTLPVRTGKERLSGKAADEQRVDNCKVPVALRGSKPRPDDCRQRARSTRTQ